MDVGKRGEKGGDMRRMNPLASSISRCDVQHNANVNFTLQVFGSSQPSGREGRENESVSCSFCFSSSGGVALRKETVGHGHVPTSPALPRSSERKSHEGILHLFVSSSTAFHIMISSYAYVHTLWQV
jgi:hypothetical protein